jgi:hypothetical protein
MRCLLQYALPTVLYPAGRRFCKSCLRRNHPNSEHDSKAGQLQRLSSFPHSLFLLLCFSPLSPLFPLFFSSLEFLISDKRHPALVGIIDNARRCNKCRHGSCLSSKQTPTEFTLLGPQLTFFFPELRGLTNWVGGIPDDKPRTSY